MKKMTNKMDARSLILLDKFLAKNGLRTIFYYNIKISKGYWGLKPREIRAKLKTEQIGLLHQLVTIAWRIPAKLRTKIIEGTGQVPTYLDRIMFWKETSIKFQKYLEDMK